MRCRRRKRTSRRELPECRSFDSAEERFALDDRSLFDMNFGDGILAVPIARELLRSHAEAHGPVIERVGLQLVEEIHSKYAVDIVQRCHSAGLREYLNVVCVYIGWAHRQRNRFSQEGWLRRLFF